MSSKKKAKKSGSRKKTAKKRAKKTKKKSKSRKAKTEKKTSGKKAKKKAGSTRTRPLDPNALRVRMYDMGFGDSFLVFLPTSSGVKKVLIDCGSIKSHHKSTAQMVEKIIEDVTVDGKPRIDVVIATHRHRDHVSGFRRDEWNNVEVGEVWMPWTENPDDGDARRILERQHGFASALESALVGMAGHSHLLQVARNALSNEEEADMLHHGFKGEPRRRFLPTKGTRRPRIRSRQLPGVTVYVLGPSRDEDVIRDMDPPSGKSYLRLLGMSDASRSGAIPMPFAKAWVDPDPDESILSAKVKKRIRDSGRPDPTTLAAALDQSVNGTSLMLLFKVGKAHLLFPGDAQWGTWNAVMEDSRTRNLLRKTTFYKVGHHGSHNATPREFVEETIGTDFVAMVPVHPYSRWPEIPREPLLKSLRKRTKKLVRGDEDAPKAPFVRVGEWYTEVEIPT